MRAVHMMLVQSHGRGYRTAYEVAQQYRGLIFPFNISEGHTTKTCSRCGHQRTMTLSDRRFRCFACGHEDGRDWNATDNIYLRFVGATLCGGPI